ncbi:MAG: type I restriction-modification system subunit M N-terminal domain-containing protein [Candidatus Latescibacterota bacterium]
MNHFGEKVGFIWSVASLLRGPYHPNQYKDVMLPMTVRMANYPKGQLLRNT